MTIYIYVYTEDGGHTESPIDSFRGFSNEECEAWAAERYYDTDIYYWAYV